MTYKLQNNIFMNTDPNMQLWEKSILYQMPHYKYCKSALNPIAIALYCSRDSKLTNCMDRLESDENSHARHMVIGKDGRIIQYAPVDAAIKHMRGKSPINNSNTIAVEICCDGKLIKSGGFYRASNGRIYGRRTVKQHGNRFYDMLSEPQGKALRDIVIGLHAEFGYLELIDGGEFRNAGAFKISPIITFEREHNEI